MKCQDETREPDTGPAQPIEQQRADWRGAITTDVRDAIAALVNYSWADEECDYCEQHPNDRAGHVFEHLEVLQAWLDENRPPYCNANAVRS